MRGRSWARMLDLERKFIPESQGREDFSRQVGKGGFWGRPCSVILMEDSIGTTFLASWVLRIFTRLLSRRSHCVCKASRNQGESPPTHTPLRTRDLPYPPWPFHHSHDHLVRPKARLRSNPKVPKLYSFQWESGCQESKSRRRRERWE